MAGSPLPFPSASSNPCSLHCDSASRYALHLRSALGLQSQGSKSSSSRSSCEIGFNLAFPLSSCNRRQTTCCGFCCRDCARRPSLGVRVCANSASMVSSLLGSGVGYLKVRTLSSLTGSSASSSTSNTTRSRASSSSSSSSSVALRPKNIIKEKSAESPAVHQPWGVVRHSAEGKQQVLEFLEKEGIDTCELHNIEIPNTIEVMQERLDFLKKLGLSLEAINSYPLMVTCSIKKNLIPVLDYLEQLGLRSRDLPKFVEKYPMVLHSSVIIDLVPVVDYLLGLDIQKKDIIKVLLKYPDVLGFRLEGTLSTSVAYLVGIGVRTRCIGRMLAEYPQILGMRVAKSIKPKVDFLTSNGIPKAIVARLLETRPYMLGFDLSATMEPVVDDLLEAGVSKAGIVTVITHYPDILGQGIRESISRKTKWLVEQVQVDPEDVPVIIEKLPQILFIKEGLAMERVKFFKNAGCSADDVAKMVTDCPQTLALSIAQVIEPSLNFLLHNMKRPMKDVIDFPAYFTYDLKSRIMPRYNMIAEKGVDCSLHWFLNCTDQIFRERLSAEYLDEDEPGPVFRMGGIIHPELKPVGEDNLLEEDLDLEDDQHPGKSEQPRPSPSRRRETPMMKQQQRYNTLEEDFLSEHDLDLRTNQQLGKGEQLWPSSTWRRETTKMNQQQRFDTLARSSNMYNEAETDDDTHYAREILRAKLQDAEDLEGLESASEFDISEEEEERDDDDEDEDSEELESAFEINTGEEEEESDDDGDGKWDMPETASEFDKSGGDFDYSGKIAEKKVQLRATGRRNR